MLDGQDQDRACRRFSKKIIMPWVLVPSVITSRWAAEYRLGTWAGVRIRASSQIVLRARGAWEVARNWKGEDQGQVVALIP
jgi:hypothetical protein